MKRKLNSGFTLMEIIVVLIIIGILATIAIPSLFGNVKKSKAAEAFSNISAIRPGIEACMLAHSGAEASSCGNNQWVTTVNPGAPCPAGVPTGACTANFGYYTWNMSNGSIQYNLDAFGMPPTFAAGLVDYIEISRNSVGFVTCTSHGALSGAC